MSVQERIRLCRLLEKMEANPEFSKEIGLSDGSHFKENITHEGNKDQGNP